VTGPASEHPHAREGVCVCPHVGLTRIPVTTCGLSAHRVAAAADAEMRRARRG
jgi:hypothetical protein